MSSTDVIPVQNGRIGKPDTAVKEIFFQLLTNRDVQDIVNRATGDNDEVIDYCLRPYCDGKLGYLGTHLRLYARTKSSGGQKRTLQFFVKVIPYDVPTQAEYVIEKGVFEQEAIFYRDIQPHLGEVLRGEPWAPVCYMVKKDLLVFEELSLKRYSMRGKLFGEELVLAGLSTLARLHAASLLAEQRLGTRLDKLYPQAFVERAFVRVGKCFDWFRAGINVTVAVAKHLGIDHTCIPSIFDEVYDAVKASSTKANVVSHGDVWANNFLFNDETPPKCLLVDFQLLRYCPLAHDISQFLYLSTNRSFREKHEKRMVKHYYRQLCETLKKNDYRSPYPSWTEVLQGMEEQRLGSSITAVLYYPTILLDETLGAKLINDPDSYVKYSLENRDAVVLENMQIDLEYGDRIKESVIELVELAHRVNELPKPS